MSTVAERETHAAGAQRPITGKLWREISRPFRRRVRADGQGGVPQPVAATAANEATESAKPYLTGSGATIAGFHPQQATVEPEAISFVQRLVRESSQFSGPIIEIGTLLGVTTTNMALVKAPQQKIITVDVYCWNPWGLSPDAHAALTRQVLYYLEQTGHVECIRRDKNEFYREYAGPAPALAFLDAWHDYEETKKDIEWAKRAGAKIIAGHDYCDEFPGVKQAVDEYGGPRELASTVWVL
jgi:predicted O-methyltransferase YrrM